MISDRYSGCLLNRDLENDRLLDWEPVELFEEDFELVRQDAAHGACSTTRARSHCTCCSFAMFNLVVPSNSALQ